MENMAEQGMPMVMQSREDMMDELVESMIAEGMSEEEAKQFLEETTASVSQPFALFSYTVRDTICKLSGSLQMSQQSDGGGNPDISEFMPDSTDL